MARITIWTHCFLSIWLLGMLGSLALGQAADPPPPPVGPEPAPMPEAPVPDAPEDPVEDASEAGEVADAKPMAEPQPTGLQGKVVHVTLYRGQALVTRAVTIEGEQGVQEVFVVELPEQTIPDSLFAEAGEGVEIRAIRYRTTAIYVEPRENVRQIDDQIEAVHEKQRKNTQQQQVVTQQLQYISQLEGFVAPTAKKELSEGVLKAETLIETTKFVFEQREQLAERQLALNEEAEELQEQLGFLQRKRSEIAAGRGRTRRDAVIFLDKQVPGPQTIRVNYLVAGAGWSPSYVFRGENDAKQVAVEYNALIQQMTGEDWSDVRLELSTASPALSAAVPGLAPFRVTLSGHNVGQQTGQPQAPNMGAPVTEQILQSKMRAKQAIASYNNAFQIRDQLDANWRANAAANDYQSLELLNPADDLKTSLEQVTDAGPSLNYALPHPVSLPSRQDQQMVRIMRTEMPASYYHVAAPVLSGFVYREAELTNNSDSDLLAGPITVYLDGRFVGRAEIPTVARGERFAVGFGADPQLRATRELVHKQDSVQGGNREMQFEYRLAIENFKEAALPVRLFDRLPYSEREKDVRVTIESMSEELSEDKTYLRLERPRGILRWDIQVPAGASGEEMKIVTYKYRAEFDRNFALTSVNGSGDASPAEQQEEFESLQLQRQKR